MGKKKVWIGPGLNWLNQFVISWETLSYLYSSNIHIISCISLGGFEFFCHCLSGIFHYNIWFLFKWQVILCGWYYCRLLLSGHGRLVTVWELWWWTCWILSVFLCIHFFARATKKWFYLCVRLFRGIIGCILVIYIIRHCYNAMMRCCIKYLLNVCDVLYIHITVIRWAPRAVLTLHLCP